MCQAPYDLLSAAETIRARLDSYMHGRASSVIGLSSTSPSEFLGMLGTLPNTIVFATKLSLVTVVHSIGLSEAVLYATRLCLALSNHANMNEDIRSMISTLIKDVEDILRLGWDGDPIMRAIPHWIVRSLSVASHVLLTESCLE
jgi:hypothetical protein